MLGAGALGSFFGGVLAQAHDVTLVGRDPHMEAVRKAGLRIGGRTEVVVRPRAVTGVRDAPVPDVLLVTVKAYDTEEALAEARPILGDRTVVASLQNGLGNLEAIRKHVDPRRVVGGVTTHGVTYEAPGVVRHAGTGYTVLGSLAGDGGPAREVRDALVGVGVEAEVSEAILGEVWAKVVVNAGINPVTAITGLPNGALVEEPHLRELVTRACEEAVAVAHAEGVELPEDDLVVRTREVAEATGSNKSSMLQDVERGKRTEIGAICGEVVTRGRVRGVETPVNQALWALVRGIESTTMR